MGKVNIMKQLLIISMCVLGFGVLFSNDYDLVVGDPEITSIHAIAFGPENVLFLGDADQAAIIAIDLSEEISEQSTEIDLTGVDKTLSQLLGAPESDIEITDMVVHQASKQVFLSVQHKGGKAMLFKIDNNTFKPIALNNIAHSKSALIDPVDADATDRRGRSLRRWAIADLNYIDGKVMLSGLSNAEFGSTFRSIPFPFSVDQAASSLEIYHAAHGKYETHAPIKSFLPIELNGEAHVLAGYTCTPLVTFPMHTMKPGEHVKGNTVAELGNWNTPVDIIELEKEGNRYVLIANTARALMQFNVDDIANFDAFLSEPTARGSTAGVDFIALPFVNVLQLDKLTDDTFVMLQRKPDGDLVLQTGSSRWLF